jgi:internalin A
VSRTKDLYLLKSLRNLTTLDLSDNSVKDARFKELLELKNLTTLNLGSTQITDAGFEGLGQLKNLTNP